MIEVTVEPLINGHSGVLSVTRCPLLRMFNVNRKIMVRCFNLALSTRVFVAVTLGKVIMTF